MSVEKSCVLAYSGGLDTSAIIPWLRHRGYVVHAVLVDVGQNEDLAELADRAGALGAATAVVRDARPKMLATVVPLALGLHATYEGSYRLGTALARPFIAAEQVLRAREIGCTALAHGATGKGNDQVRFEFAYRTLAPDCEIIAPWKQWSFAGRADLIAFLEQSGHPHPFEENKVLSLDENLWHLSVEGGDLENPSASLDVSDYLDAVHDRFARGAEIPQRPLPDAEIRFDHGVPVAWNGQRLELGALVAALNATYRDAGWAWDLVLENRFTGVKSRGIYINPAAKLLQLAAEGLARHCFNKPTYDLYVQVAQRYANLLYQGQYFSQQRRVVEASARELLGHLNGSVRVRLEPQPYVSQVRAQDSLFTQDLATFERSSFSHEDAEGFIKLSWLGSVGQPENEESLREYALETEDSAASGSERAAPLLAG